MRIKASHTSSSQCGRHRISKRVVRAPAGVQLGIGAALVAQMFERRHFLQGQDTIHRANFLHTRGPVTNLLRECTWIVEVTDQFLDRATGPEDVTRCTYVWFSIPNTGVLTLETNAIAHLKSGGERHVVI